MAPSVPTYAILGATGSTGSALLRHLLPRTDVHLNIYVRSAEKLKRLVPETKHANNITIFTGSITSDSALVKCLSGVTIVFNAVAQNDNEPGCHIAQDVSKAVVSALSELRSHNSDFQPPLLVFISSGALVQRTSPEGNTLAHRLLYNASWNVYEDLRVAEEWLAAEAPWLSLVRVCPGGLVPSEEVGFEITEGEFSPTIGYTDLAAAMIQVGEDKKTNWAGKQVALKSKGEPRFDLLRRNITRFLIPGSIVSWVPFTFPLFKRIGLMQ